MIFGLGEVAHAVELIDDADEDADGGHERSVPHEAVVDVGQAVGRGALQHDLHDADGSEGVHLFVGDDEGVVGDADDIDDAGEDGELEHPAGGFHALRGDVDFVVENPQTGTLQQDEHEGGEDEDDVEGGAEHAVHAAVLAPHLEGDEALHGSGDATGEDGEHVDDAAHHAIDTHVLHSEVGKYQPCGPQVEPHGEEHADVEEKGVLDYSVLVVGL